MLFARNVHVNVYVKCCLRTQKAQNKAIFTVYIHISHLLHTQVNILNISMLHTGVYVKLQILQYKLQKKCIHLHIFTYTPLQSGVVFVIMV